MMNATAYGTDALLLRFAERADEAAFHLCHALVAELERHPPAGLREIVPAFTTLLIVFENSAQREAAREMVEKLTGSKVAEADSFTESRLHEIPVHYAGPDLARVAGHAGLSVEEVIDRHATPEYRVHCLGFAPGFPYLGGLDPRLHTPRLATPRPRVPAGSVAIGGEHTGIYSVASPGGWNLVGQTHPALFEATAATLDGMFLLRAGDRVQLIRSAGALARENPSASILADEGVRAPSLRVLSPGFGLSLQDQGRPGFARFGVPPGGAMDPHAAAWANRLLDNPSSAAVLELCLQGQRLEVLRDGWLAVTGSSTPRGQARNHAFRVRAGDTLEFPPGPDGVWSYLAVPGGFAGQPVLGSLSANPRAGIGRALAAGDELAGAMDANLRLPSGVAGRAMPWDEVIDFAGPTVLRVWPGPQWESFSADDRERFFAGEWTVSSQCDRVGYRLSGPALQPGPSQIISEPVRPGSIQVPASGQPIVTMPDGPTLGGYPKPGLVDPADLPRLAQCRAGQRVRFVCVG